MLKGKTVVLAVSGSIACYKAAELTRILINEGARVRVIMTKNAQEFITPLTFQTLSGNLVATDTFSLTQESEIGHIRLADSADVLLIAPATANIIGKLANGIADDLLTTVLMATTAPVLIAPAMNVHMYNNPILQQNMARLKSLGYHFIEPGEGSLACGYEGKGRLADPTDIVEAVKNVLTKKALVGENVLVTAGPNREPIDPVRFISNRSTGKMGFALARIARRRGATVTLISGPTSLIPPYRANFRPVDRAVEMHRAVMECYPAATIVIMAAAVADYRPTHMATGKIKKGSSSLILELERNPDIAAELGGQKGDRLLVGFATETEELIANARRKLIEKNFDLIVANDVTQKGAGFATDTNIVTLIDRTGGVEHLPLMTKDEVAAVIFDRILVLKESPGLRTESLERASGP
ncbi:MAG: bifunctional phosphopantothenoylcysteine decarboxylase/phosphopantothenate--cysteine ligase CoaBC [Deltaproteobacteria bacterium]|nr:bifunctional phosphopantothenoylcysteine decarboxylase/phosphopantothenate--cysteine ligase CoaBC [Deltaproteobacteria bacterium]